MKWSTFLLDLSFFYMIYYGLNIAYDILKGRSMPKSGDSDHVLFFEEHSQPQLILPADMQGQKQDEEMEHPSSVPLEPAIRSTGGISIRQLFELAKADLIEHTSTIPY